MALPWTFFSVMFDLLLWKWSDTVEFIESKCSRKLLILHHKFVNGILLIRPVQIDLKTNMVGKIGEEDPDFWSLIFKNMMMYTDENSIRLQLILTIWIDCLMKTCIYCVCFWIFDHKGNRHDKVIYYDCSEWMSFPFKLLICNTFLQY